MIHFFRRIRQKLINEGKSRRYLLYALGEILLVMLGILLALQVNNWNERRKSKIVEIDYLQRLRTDLQNDTSILNQRILLSQRERKSFYDYVHQSYETQKTERDFKDLLSLIFWNADNLILKDNTFSEILSSGKLELISNPQLKDLITDYYRRYEIAASQIGEMNQTSINMLMMANEHGPIIKYYRFSNELFDKERMFNKNEWAFINDPGSKAFRLYENAAAYYSFKHLVFMEHYNDLLSQAEEVLKGINLKLGN